MFKCKICDFLCIRGSGHIKAKHDIETIEYLKEYEQIDVIELYLTGASASQIVNIIKNKNIGVNPIKKDILLFLKKRNIEIRNTSEAIKKWSEQRGGPWNKGKTKQDHASIASYSEKRMGKNNGYYTGTEESRIKTRWWLNKNKDEIELIRNKISDNLRKQYQNGQLKPYSFTNPTWEQQRIKNCVAGYHKWRSAGGHRKGGNYSKAEITIRSILEELGIKYIWQYGGLSKYLYDFMIIEKNIIIEYNGTYWHCDPRKYKKNYFNSKVGKKAKEIWEQDKIKIDLATGNGYDVLVFWEEDFTKLTYNEKKDFINEAIKSISNKKSA